MEPQGQNWREEPTKPQRIKSQSDREKTRRVRLKTEEGRKCSKGRVTNFAAECGHTVSSGDLRRGLSLLLDKMMAW